MPIVVPVNYLAVIAATISSMVLGFLWYGPLFGKPWMHLMGLSKESMGKKEGMGMRYALMGLGALVMAYVLSHSLVFASTYTQTSGISAGLMVGFWSWLGFIAPVEMGSQLWEGKPWKLFLIQGGYWLVSLCIMGLILALWK